MGCMESLFLALSRMLAIGRGSVTGEQPDGSNKPVLPPWWQRQPTPNMKVVQSIQELVDVLVSV